jgi:hypothetical protein
MKPKRTPAFLALAAGLATFAMPYAPAFADGAASTRNIIIGGAAAAAGTLILINHNKQVHAKEDQMASAQASAEANADNAQAAYASERRAYKAQVAINSDYKHEVAVQHSVIVQLRRQLASAQRPRTTAVAVPQQAAPAHVATTSMGWGNL